MSEQTNSKVAASALQIEGTNAQIHAICRNKNNWEAELKFNGKTIPLNRWDIKKTDSVHSMLCFSLYQPQTFFKENFGAVAKDLIFKTGSLKANEVLTPLVTNGMKVRILTSDDQEFTLKKSTISFIKKKLVK